MKRATALLCLLSSVLLAADNDVSAPQWSASKDGVVKWRTTDAAGVHTPHVAIAGNSFVNITTAATTLAKSGAGVLHVVNVNTLGTVASTITIYDSLTASGTKIGTINSLSISGPQIFDVAFSTGLCIVSTGTVAPDVTVSFR